MEIKYRGYSSRLKKWVYGSYIKTTLQPARIIHDINSDPEWVDEGSLGLFVGNYTNIYDGEGEFSVYEGDIIACGSDDDGSPHVLEVQKGGIIEVVGIELNIKALNYSCEVIDEFTVIGNVYQNPDLLIKQAA